MHSNGSVTASFPIHLVILGSLFLTARAGWLVKRRRMSAVGAGFVPMMFIFAYIATVSPQSWDYSEGSFALMLGFIGFALFASGAIARKWWDHLPRNSDR
ncbi:MAG: hypothetical protein H8F28_04635 [Fibrella sp.]|nr:hypothetical protein [Armatimonadota bacterium]